MIIEKQAKDLASGVTEVAHKIEILCPNCGRDIDEDELAAKECADCGENLAEPQENVAVCVTSNPLIGVTF